ncbi:putative sgc region protein SgcQ [compost metagenome]
MEKPAQFRMETNSIEGIVEAARRDLMELQDADVDAVMFGNENDRPYELAVDVASKATMAYVIGRLRGEIAKPFGVNVLWGKPTGGDPAPRQ